MKRVHDIIVVGGGIVGACIARTARARTGASVLLLDKSSSSCLPEHGSARNSGVMHAGFYYTGDSLKAKLTRKGNVFLHQYCQERGIPVNECGKLVLARSEAEMTQYDVLLARAAANGAPLERVSPKEVLELEPLARSEFGGLWSPSTATADPVQVTRSLLQDAVREGVILRPDSHVQRLVPDGDGVRVCLHSGESTAAAHVVNCAGLHADTFAHQLGFGRRYSILPFKGLYMQCVGLPLRRLVYPVPQLRGDGGHAPFLGVHFTVTAAGGVKIGPTAIPALWREQYAGLQGFNLQEMLGVLATQLRLALGSDFNFRRLAAQEVMKYIPSVMQAGARDLVPSAGPQHFGAFSRAGIRAQLVDTERGSLEMDFIVEGGTSSTHILNAVSPGWTCSQPFAEMVVQDRVLPALRRSSSTAVA